MVHPDIPSYLCKLMKKNYGHGYIPGDTLSGHGISGSSNVSKLSVAWFIRKVLMENEEKFYFILYIFYLSFWGALWL